MLQRPTYLLKDKIIRSFVYMTRQISLDVSPPPYSGSRDILDKSAFHKTIPILAARTSARKVASLLKADVLRSCRLDIPKVTKVEDDPPRSGSDTKKLVLLDVSKKEDLPDEAREFLAKEDVELVHHEIKLDYNYWTTDEILQAFLPEGLREGSPTGFTMTGHIAHINLNEPYLPFKHIIGQVIIDKNPLIKTVVNKSKMIDNQFRFFQLDLIAGEPNYVVEHHEQNCRFVFDFSQVYWNSRLHSEHERLVRSLRPEDVVADVFAGVGPFAIPAARKGCGVLANDLNPSSVKYLSHNVDINHTSDLVRISCEDGNNFIKSAVARLYDNPFPPHTPRPSQTQAEKARRLARKMGKEYQQAQPLDFDPCTLRRKISHFIMNLPDSSITFLDAFRGILVDGTRPLSEVYDVLPMLHCHSFTRKLIKEEAEFDIQQRVEEKLGHPVDEDVSFHFVRSVAPNKNMYCISFRLPRPVAFSA